VCAGLVPEIFDVDDEDILHIAAGDVPPELADGARRAGAVCPRPPCASRTERGSPRGSPAGRRLLEFDPVAARVRSRRLAALADRTGR